MLYAGYSGITEKWSRVDYLVCGTNMAIFAVFRDLLAKFICKAGSRTEKKKGGYSPKNRINIGVFLQ